MNYCIINSEKIIENIIVAEPDFAESIGALEMYDSARIGDKYQTAEERLEAENNLLKAKIEANTQQNEFLEDCIAEMAETVYA